VAEGEVEQPGDVGELPGSLRRLVLRRRDRLLLRAGRPVPRLRPRRPARRRRLDTGLLLGGSPATIRERQAEVDEILAAFFPAKTSPADRPAPAPTEVDVDDRELVERMLERRPHLRQLWDGDTSGYGGDHSRADLALAREVVFWAGGDPARTDRIFRGSGLMRPKWDDPRGASTYGADTIALAVVSAEAFYAPKAAR
jgi:hypothetical protein